jgi:hypothetical protein
VNSKPSRATLPADAKIKLLTKINPHRKGTGDARKYAKLATGHTVEAAKAAGIDLGYLRYMALRKLIAFG